MTIVAFLFLSTGTAFAELQPRGDHMVYDTDLDITWATDVDPQRHLTWADANDWAENLVYQGYDDWRLPISHLPDPACTTGQGHASGDSTGHHCTGGEMGHLFYLELGGRSNLPITSSQDPDVDLFGFDGLGGRSTFYDYFWSSDRRIIGMGISNEAWKFSFLTGQQFLGAMGRTSNVIAVRDGDVTVSDAANLDAPSHLTISSASQTRLTLVWRDNSTGEDGFIIEQLDHMTQATGFSTNWSNRATTNGLGASNTSNTGHRTFLMTGLRSRTHYCFRIKAYRGGDTTDATQMVCARTL